MVPILFLIAQAAADDAAPASPSGVVRVTGREQPDLASFDRLMTSFLVEHEIPGAALAVARQGRLVYARGFGLADVEEGQAVEPDDLFRIASISKPITGVAVLQLVEQEKLSLDDRVYDLLKWKWPARGGFDPRLKDVTVRQLLQHTGGWDRDVSFDPMFRSVEFARELNARPPAKPRQIIRCMLTQELDFDPGSRYAYSNFGYCLLGRVIETVSGKDYDEYVRECVLQPLGIRRMQIGATLLSGRAEGEVRYYTPEDGRRPAVVGPRIGAEVPEPYGAWYLEAMDAHGGWIASAVDLVRFASALDEGASPALLGDSARETMFARPEGAAGFEDDGRPRDAYYGCGWMVRPVGENGRNTWHGGKLDGTATLLVRRHDGLTWAVLFNSHATRDGEFPVSLIDPLLHQAADEVAHWPTHDLFSAYLDIPQP